MFSSKVKSRLVSTRPLASVRTGTFELYAVFKIRTVVYGATVVVVVVVEVVVEVVVTVVVDTVVVVISVCGHS